ncbi:MAG: serine/threonine protein kinase [Planctomycetes bacterium]|nr:serine/threonine protein kinase [Planctomycetota bacterium]
MSPAQTDRNLLLGILAFQNAFITRDALFAGMQAWLYDKATPLVRILQNQGALDKKRCTILEALVDQHVQQHECDPQKSLAAVSSVSSVRNELEQLPDPDLQASLVHLCRDTDNDALATRSLHAGTSTSAGTRFVILRPHARGGLGQVFVALDTELNREVALKEMQARLADNPANRVRFLQEAEITGGLEHPGIVPVYGLGTYDDGRPFYAMRFIKGHSLMDAIEELHGRPASGDRPPPEKTLPCRDTQSSGHLRLPRARIRDRFTGLKFRQLLRRLIDVCNALQYAHDRGVLHRDLKPHNIMLGKYGETLVVDWGLAKPVGHAFNAAQSAHEEQAPFLEEKPLIPASATGSAETVAGTALGTPAYMSPEQAAGRLDLLGPASDVYSLGATLYCMLTGQPPFQGATADVLKKVQRAEFRAPRQTIPSISRALEAVCLKAMSLKPQERYAAPRELAEDIEDWLADEPLKAWPEPWTVQARRWVSRHRTIFVSGAAGVLTALLALVLATVLLTAANHAERQAKNAARGALEQRDKAIVREQETASLFLRFLKSNPNVLKLAPLEIRNRFLREFPEIAPPDLGPLNEALNPRMLGD